MISPDDNFHNPTAIQTIYRNANVALTGRNVQPEVLYKSNNCGEPNIFEENSIYAVNLTRGLIADFRSNLKN